MAIQDIIQGNKSIRDKKVVGWGSGTLFDHFYDKLQLPLAYIIDNDLVSQGTVKSGLKIYPPEQLLTENPKQTIIVIYSSFYNEIVRQLAEMGPFTSVDALTLSSDYLQQWERTENLAQKSLLAHNEIQNNPSSAILIQGPIIGEITIKIAKIYAHNYPGIPIVVSSWKATGKKLVDEIAPYVDSILMNVPPSFPGVQNRNLQIVSTQKGLYLCRKLGVERVLKVRSDMFIMAEGLFEKCEKLFSKYRPTICRMLGADNRIIIPNSYTRKYIPFHPSDLIMYGTTKDLLNFWKCPVDYRQFDLREICRTWSMSKFGYDGGVAEAYFGTNYCKALGYPLGNSIIDSWSFYRDLFIIVDNDFFDIFWPKNPHLIDSIPPIKRRETIGCNFWRSLISGQTPTVDININYEIW